MPGAQKRGEALEKLMRLGFSHQGVQAILLWGFEASTHWMGPDAALMNADGSLNAAGKRIDHLLREEWTTRGAQSSDKAGRASFRGFYGVYTVAVTTPDGRKVERTVTLSADQPKAQVVY